MTDPTLATGTPIKYRATGELGVITAVDTRRGDESYYYITVNRKRGGTDFIYCGYSSLIVVGEPTRQTGPRLGFSRTEVVLWDSTGRYAFSDTGSQMRVMDLEEGDSEVIVTRDYLPNGELPAPTMAGAQVLALAWLEAKEKGHL